MTQWGWKPERSQGIWRHGPLWLRPFSVAAPWIALGLLLLMFHLIGGTLTAAKGVLFDLPAVSADLAEGESTTLVALVTPTPHETYVFFDDSRYTLDDETSAAAFRDHLAVCADRTKRKTLLVMADRRVSSGELSRIAVLARRGGVARILFANKRPEVSAE
jgi:biopolymer transport protein ExbD